MDLSFARIDRHVTVLPTELAVLLVGVVTRQGTSPTARAQAGLTRDDWNHAPLAPRDGAFDGRVAAALTRWQVT